MHRCAIEALVAAALMTSSIEPAPAQDRGQQAPSLILESIAGRDSFNFYCAPCHGTTGKGNGPVAAALKSEPADLTVLARPSGGGFPRDRVLATLTGAGRPLPAHGSTEMPVWGPIFRGLDRSDARVLQRIENVIAYVETLQEATTDSIDPGMSLFRTYCAPCHGTTARGDGPAADRFLKPPPDLTKYTASNGGVFPTERVYRIVDGRDVRAHGSREMPVWGDVFKRSGNGTSDAAVKARIEAIVRYLRAIQQRAA